MVFILSWGGGTIQEKETSKYPPPSSARRPGLCVAETRPESGTSRQVPSVLHLEEVSFHSVHHLSDSSKV